VTQQTKQQSSRLHRMRKWCRLTCLQEFIDTATRWVYGWSRLVTGHKKAKVAEIKPSQYLPLHSKTALNPHKIQQQKPNQWVTTTTRSKRSNK